MPFNAISYAITVPLLHLHAPLFIPGSKPASTNATLGINVLIVRASPMWQSVAPIAFKLDSHLSSSRIEWVQVVRVGTLTASLDSMKVSLFYLVAAGAFANTACTPGGLEQQPPSTDGGTSADASTVAPTYFRPAIQSDLGSANCLGGSCHGGGTMPMQLTPSPTSETEWQGNYQEASTRTATLIAKATGSGGHPAVLTEGDPMLRRWQAWISAGAPYEASTAPDAGVPSDAGPSTDATSGALIWEPTIRQLLLSDGCTECHGLQGGYSLETYGGTLGFGSDQTIPNVIPGDENSLLITYYDDEHYTTSTANAALIREWIVDELAIK